MIDTQTSVNNNLRLGTRVRISGAAGVCIGRIEDIRPIDEMPDLPDFQVAGEFAPREIMRELGVTRVALISFFVGDQEVVFTALEIGGAWCDLRRQALVLEVIGQACKS